MSEFIIKSNDSDLLLRLSDIKDDFFTAEIISNRLTAKISVYGYCPHSYSFADFFERLASQDKPWETEQCWESLEGEFKLAATCSSLGAVIFTVNFNQNGGEDWNIETEIRSDLGQIPELARTGRLFFSQSPI